MSAGRDGRATKKKKKKKKSAGGPTSRQIDAKYVGRARSVFGMIDGLIDIYDDEAELAAMNRGKRGSPYRYTHSLIAAISRIRARLSLDFRSCEGMLPEGRGPAYTTIFRRVNAQDESIREGLSDVACGDVAICLVPDGTGVTPAARSEYVRVVHRLRRGFLRLTIMISRETLEIVAFELTKETVGEPTVFESLLENALRNMGMDPEERRRMVRSQKNRRRKAYRTLTLTADGGYDSREIFSACKKLGITPNIRIRKNANCKAGGADRARTEAVYWTSSGAGRARRRPGLPP